MSWKYWSISWCWNNKNNWHDFKAKHKRCWNKYGYINCRVNYWKKLKNFNVTINYKILWKIYKRNKFRQPRGGPYSFWKILEGKLQTFWRARLSLYKVKTLRRKLVLLLESDNEKNQAIACYDLGEFCRYHPYGKK